jgi:hypothetical protein
VRFRADAARASVIQFVAALSVVDVDRSSAGEGLWAPGLHSEGGLRSRARVPKRGEEGH